MALTGIRYLKTVSRKYSSALYITGDKAQTNFVVLTPYIDFEEQLKNKSDLIKNIEARKLTIDIDKIEKRWNFFKMIDDHKNILEITRTEINNLITKLKTEDQEKNKNDIEKLLLHSKLVKDDLKNVKDYSYGIEESAALAVLSLPNFLHTKTPSDFEKIVHQYLEKSLPVNQSHMQIGESLNLITYTNPMLCYLKSEAALFEFALINYFHECMLDLDYVQFSNADFARSVVVEGCGCDHLDKTKIFTLDENSQGDLSRLHLVGGASLYSFMAYFAKHLVQETALPLQLFSIGRNYKPVEEDFQFDLFNMSQNSCGHIFVATEDDLFKMDETVDSMTQQIIKIYEPLGYHFRLVYVPAGDLKINESLRLSIQMFSNYQQKYVEVGYLSLYDNYLSKRLLFTYSSNKERKFLKVIAGEVVNVQKMLGCVLENNFSSKTPLLNALLQKYL